jgi:HlyD family secretion protein
MSIGIPSASAIRSGLWLGVAVLSVSVYAARTTAFESLRNQIYTAPSTTLPARIEPGQQTELIAEFAGRVREANVQPGQHVEAGAVLFVLENEELNGQVAAATKRVEAAEAHLEAARSLGTSEKSKSLLDEQRRAALRARDMAKERLNAYRLSDAERALESARTAVKEIRGLLREGFATTSELDTQLSRQENASRELEAAREHLSRLREEVEQAESNLRMVDLQAGVEPVSTSGTEADLADARSALAVAEERVRRLTIIAPHGGVVLDSSLKTGDSVPAGGRLLTIADLSFLSVSAPIDGSLARMLRAGQSVTVLLPGNRTLTAAVTSVALRTENAGQTYRVDVRIQNPDPGNVVVGLDAQLRFDHTVAR